MIVARVVGRIALVEDISPGPERYIVQRRETFVERFLVSGAAFSIERKTVMVNILEMSKPQREDHREDFAIGTGAEVIPLTTGGVHTGDMEGRRRLDILVASRADVVLPEKASQKAASVRVLLIVVEAHVIQLSPLAGVLRRLKHALETRCGDGVGWGHQ